MRAFLAIALYGVVSSTGMAFAQDVPERDSSYVPPSWLSRPAPEDIRAALPADALRQGRSGEVRLNCRLTTDGVARDCSVTEESPEGLGFGAAALMLSRQFLLRPATEHGVPVETRISTTVRFEMPARGARNVSRQTYVETPTWLAAPSRADMDAAFPNPERGQEGHVVLDCRVRADGGLQRCRTLSEVPEHRGFGPAARGLADRFRMAPIPGVEMSDLFVQVPFHFDLPGQAAESAENRMMTNPDWRSLPDAPEALDTFPPQARALGLTEGRATVSCRIQSDGTTADCAAREADPPGVGFEEAAVSLARLFAVNPWSADGRPFQRERVSIPFRFVDPSPTAPAAEP